MNGVPQPAPASVSITRRLAATLLLLVLLPGVVAAQLPDQFAAARERMVTDFIAAEGVKNPRVLDSVRKVPRHLFVRSELRHMAYYDQALDIGFKQTISPPFIVAYMTESLDPQPTDRVLEIGTGSGYQAAVLSGLVAEVYTIEIVEPLGTRAAALLERQGYKNVHCKVGDGYQGWPEHAPFDKIIVTCSPEDVPGPLVEQLKEGGRMIVPLGERYQQVFHLFEKKEGKLLSTKLLPTLFVPMTGRMEELREVQPDPAHPRLVNGDFEKWSAETKMAEAWHYQRRSNPSADVHSGTRSIQFTNAEPGRMAHMLQALAVDGSKVRRLDVGWSIKSNDIRSGHENGEQPGILLHFFDERRLPLSILTIGPWLADEKEWASYHRVVEIPRGARELIVQAGLNGATGSLWLDDLTISAVP